MFINAVVTIPLDLTLKGTFNGNGVLLEFSQFYLDLADGHLGDELVHIHLLLAEDRVGELLPDLLNYIQTSIHLAVL